MTLWVLVLWVLGIFVGIIGFIFTVWLLMVGIGMVHQMIKMGGPEGYVRNIKTKMKEQRVKEKTSRKNQRQYKRDYEEMV
jgi:hypothetical protein